MPISRLEFVHETMFPVLEIAVLIDHLLACKTTDHLVTLRLFWQEPIQNFSSTFIPFLQACKKLKCFELFMCDTTGIDVLLESWLENRPESLEKVIIDIVNLHNENDAPGWINVNEYVSLLKLAGLNISEMGGCLSTKMDPTVRFLIHKRLTKTIESNEKEDCEKQGKWSELPSLPLEAIYSFLRRKDQVNMSLVCRSWSEGYGSRSVWNTFRFDLTESQMSLNTCPVMKFVHKYSSMIRHVEILSTCSNNCLMKNWSRHLVEFLKILSSKTQLTSVKFLFFAHHLWSIDTPTYNDICREIVDFLESQRHLKRVEFDYCLFNFPECVEILRKLTESSRESLMHLKDVEQDPNAAQKIPKLADLPSLRTLETDYSFIFENMVPRQSTAIQTVKLVWEEPTEHLSSTINNFLKACKQLKCLELIIYSPTSGIDVLLESWLENRPESLEEVIIEVSDVDDEYDIPGWINIRKYVSLLKKAGLKISVYLDT
ncbi:hypothetical protein AVEN_8569-1 [Araneus ventricosus]|uniref:F-box domain-containing protein n=1 Tax=Araneus ventricosus TaxID=182803 RepID=A0A4Y2TY95_ARAVE|nr:hypothetical protein AVEN_8569-1 [Araneus ventricosus]